MRVINKDELKHNPYLLLELKKSIFIYPTDTIYGIGCDATNHDLVDRLRRIKRSPEQPFSVIIPNKNMIYEFCDAGDDAREWVDKLPGAYTLIFKVKKKFVADNVNPQGGTIGVRIPNHWFYRYIKLMRMPVVTTSANISGQDFMTTLEDLDDDIKKHVDFIIYDGELKSRPSTIVNLAKEGVEIKDRSKRSIKEKIRGIKKIFKKRK